MSAIKVLTLGAGQDIGRSCVIVTLGGRRIMFDCGMHMGYNDHRRFPDWRQLGVREGEPLTGAIDCVVITHFHLDHCGALPYLTEVLGYAGPIYMTQPTAVICAIMLKDYVHVMVERKGREGLYSPADVDACLRKVTYIGLGESVAVDTDLRLASHYAGHVLGAIMVSAEWYAAARRASPKASQPRARRGARTALPFSAALPSAHLSQRVPGRLLRPSLGQRVVYTGDFNTTADRHLGAARIGRLEPHVYALHAHMHAYTHAYTPESNGRLEPHVSMLASLP